MSQPCIPAGHRLFHLTVSKTWTAEIELLVAAASIDSAKALARRRAKLDTWDADAEDTEIESVAEVPLATVKEWEDVDMAPDIDAIAYVEQPPGSPNAEKIDAEELIRLLLVGVDDRLEQLRLATIEHNNGQIPLPLSSDVAP
jgi:hypothetical protein